MTDTTNTPTPETDSAEAMVEQTDYSNTGRGQERQRKEAAWEYARSLETRLAAALSELAAMRSGAGVLPEGCPETLEYFTRTQSLFINVEDYDPVNPEPSVVVEIHPVGTRARLAALTGQAKKGGG